MNRQIDESLFQRKRKYNRSRLQHSDYEPRSLEYSDEISNVENETPVDSVENNRRNYGNTIHGSLVFGLCFNDNNIDF